MKLSIIMDSYGNPHAGTESQVLKLVEGLVSKGWDVRFAVFRGSDYTRGGQFPVAVEDLGIGRISDPASWFKVFRYGRHLKSDGFTLVHCFFNDSSVICPPMIRLAGLVPIISRRDMGFWYTSGYKKMLRLTGRFVKAAICNSQAVANITRTVEGLPAEKIQVIYNGYPDTGPVNTKADHNATRGADDDIVIGIVANLRPIKRIEDLIRAAGLLVETGHRVKLRVIGGGDKAPYEAKIAQLGLQAHVDLLGSQAEPEAFIQHFDIAVLCSESEGFSNAIIEYMRCEKPVVCTDTGGNPEIVCDGVNGYLVQVGNVEALADRLTTLIQNPELREKMGRQGAEMVRGRYSTETMLRKHISLYQSLVPGVSQT